MKSGIEILTENLSFCLPNSKVIDVRLLCLQLGMKEQNVA